MEPANKPPTVHRIELETASGARPTKRLSMIISDMAAISIGILFLIGIAWCISWLVVHWP